MIVITLQKGLQIPRPLYLVHIQETAYQQCLQLQSKLSLRPLS